MTAVTPSLLRRPPLLAALAVCFALLGAAPAGAAVGPGAVLRTGIGQCTFNFLFDGSDGARYIASAGHCVLGGPELGSANLGEKVWPTGSGPVARDENRTRIGEFAYAILQDPKDFSLIRLDTSVPATPQMPFFGGPTGVFTDTSSALRVLQYFGQGIGVSSVLPERYAIAVGTPDSDHIYAQGVVVSGDSGSAIETSDGLAAGVVVTTGLHSGTLGGGGIDAGLIGITRLPPQVARAEQQLGITLTLRTAPLLSAGSGTVIEPTSGSGPHTAVPPPAPATTGSGNTGPAASPPPTTPIPLHSARKPSRRHTSHHLRHKRRHHRARHKHSRTRHR
jgi:hypothetical protein